MKGLAVAGVAGNITHEKHHGRGILKSGVHADGGIGRARPARHKADARAAGEFARSLGHEGGTALLPVDDEFNIVFVGMKAVQHRQKTLPRNAKSVGHPLGNEAFDQQMAG